MCARACVNLNLSSSELLRIMNCTKVILVQIISVLYVVEFLLT